MKEVSINPVKNNSNVEKYCLPREIASTIFILTIDLSQLYSNNNLDKISI